MIGKFETNKDLIQELTASGARHVGNIASIITGTVAEVTREIGEWITDAIEMNEAAAAARRDAAAAARDDAEFDAVSDDDEFAGKTSDGKTFAEKSDFTAGPVAEDVSYVDAEVVDADDDTTTR